MSLEYQVPCHQKSTQSTTSPEYHSGSALPLRCSFKLFVSTAHVLCCGQGIEDQLGDVGGLYVKILDQGSLQLGYLKH